MQNRKIIINFMFQVFPVVLKILFTSFYCSSPPIKDSLPFDQPTPFILMHPH